MGGSWMKIIEKLTHMKNELDELKQKKAQAEGRLQQLMKQLKDDFQFTNIDDAKEYADKQADLIEKEKATLEKLVQELEEGYDWQSI